MASRDLQDLTVMVFSIAYTIAKGPKLDASQSQSVKSVNCQYECICQHQQLLEVKIYLHYDI